MKTFLLPLCLLMTLAVLTGCQTGGTSGSNPTSSSYARIQKEMVVLLEQWHRAIVNRDTDTLDRLWADEYRSVNPSGQIVPKEEDLRLVSAPDLVFERLVVQDVEIPYHDRSTVVATSLTNARGVYRGQSFGGQFRNTVVFEKRLGAWKAIWGQSTEIPPPSAVQ